MIVTTDSRCESILTCRIKKNNYLCRAARLCAADCDTEAGGDDAFSL
jgi:hypothetical protein